MKQPAILVAAVLLVGLHAIAAEPVEETDEDLGDLDLEQLMQVPVTSVAGVAQPLQDTPAALFVITPEDIRRGGHLTIPAALRTVPGMDVARISANIWAISARGLNDRFSTKLLVLVDGRAVYNDLFSGVYWDVESYAMEDIDRIEVVRGPGATLWGANAVNGVINIESKSARETQGWLVSGGAGNFQRLFGTVRYGGKLGRDSYFRVYGKYLDHDNFEFETPPGGDAPDDWNLGSGGFRVDVEPNPDTTVTIQGEAHDGTIGSQVVLRESFNDPRAIDTDASGAHLLVRVDHLLSATSGVNLKVYFDRAERERPGFFNEERDTLEVDFRHHHAAGQRHALIWGGAYRHRSDETEGSPTLSMVPPDDSRDLYNVFIQDTIGLREERLSLMVGSKFENNDFTGFEWQPSVRLSWTPDGRRTLWGAVSGAVRTPSRASQDSIVTVGILPGPTPVRLLGNPTIEAENLIAFEVGYRFRPEERWTVDIAGFFNSYSDLISIGAPTANPFEVTFSNGTEGESHGLEIATWWTPGDRWRLSGSYSYFDLRLDGIDESDEETAPQHKANLQSQLDLTSSLELNAAAYYVDEIRESDVDAYARLDLGLTWKPRDGIELAFWGQNLLEDGHVEFVDTFFVVHPIEVPRSVYGQLTLRF